MPAFEARPILLVVIPGNPGDAVFYADFARALEGLGHEALVTSHLTLLAPPASLAPYALHQVAAVTRHLTGTGRSVADVEVVLLGHSVGAYLAHLIVAQGLLPVSRVFMLCPLLTRPARSGRWLLQLVTSPRLYARFLGFWRVFPARLQRWLIALSGAGPHGAWVQAALASSQPLAWAAMAGAEVAEIASRTDVSYLFEEPLFRDPERFVALLARRDRWAPRAWSDPRACLWLDGLDHAFVVKPAQCQVVASAIHQRLLGTRPAARAG